MDKETDVKSGIKMSVDMKSMMYLLCNRLYSSLRKE